MKVGDELDLTLAGNETVGIRVTRSFALPTIEYDWRDRKAEGLTPLTANWFRRATTPRADGLRVLTPPRRRERFTKLTRVLAVVVVTLFVLCVAAYAQSGTVAFCHNAIRLFVGGKVVFDWVAIASYAMNPNEHICQIAWAARQS